MIEMKCRPDAKRTGRNQYSIMKIPRGNICEIMSNNRSSIIFQSDACLRTGNTNYYKKMSLPLWQSKKH